jgi:hypothetical protein
MDPGKRVLIFAGGVVAGLLILLVVRFMTLEPEPVTHFHANFAVFVDGERMDLSAPRFMEDVEKCKADPNAMDPRDRVHLHNQDHDVVHVHAPASTWSHVFANLGMGLGDRWMVTEQGAFLGPSGSRSLKFVLNGSSATDIANRAIRSEDRLLISYGEEPVAEVLRTQFPHVKSNAGEFNDKLDPGGCGARHEPGFLDKLRRAAGLRANH